MGMTLPIFFLNGEACVKRNYVSKVICTEVKGPVRERSTLQDPGCNASTGFWSRDLRSKILLPHDLCKEHLHGYCFQAIVAIIT